MKLYVFTKKDIDRFLIECNFTPDEEKLFRLRCQEHTLEYCAEQMSLMRCVVATMTITANVEESATAWEDTAQMMAG